MSKRFNQNGFTAFEVVVVGLLLLAIGLAGYAAYQSYQNANKGEVTQKQTTAKATNNTISTGNVVKINELGVQLTFKDGQKASYTYEAGVGTDYDGASTGELRSATFKINGCEAGAITRIGINPDGKMMASEPKKIGDFYVYAGYPNGGPEEGCSNMSSEFKAAYSTVTAIK